MLQRIRAFERGVCMGVLPGPFPEMEPGRLEGRFWCRAAKK